MYNCKSRYVWAIYNWLLEIGLLKKKTKNKKQTKQNKNKNKKRKEINNTILLHLLYKKTTTLLNSKSKLEQRINGIAKRQTRVLEIFLFSLHLRVKSCHI